MNLRNTILSFCSIAFLSLFASSLSANNLYWVGGQGNWTNTAKWSTSSGGAPSTSLPDENTTVIFDINSGLSAGNNVNIPGGEHSVEGFVVTGITTNFKIRFIGTNSDPTVMNIHGDLNLLTTHSMVYAGDALHRWEFHGKNTGSQEIKSSGKNLHYIRFPNDDKDYHLNGDLLVTDFISYIGGNLNTNNYNITAEEFNVLNNGSATTSQKNLTLGTSTINCDKYNAELTYGTLNITGNYTLKAKNFFGAPSQTNDPTTHPKIILKDYEASSLFDNNFTCTDCLIDTLIIENSFDTKLQGSFVIEHLLEIIEPGNTIFFNVINSISNQVTVNGQVITPSVTGCDDRTAFQGYNSDIIDLHRSTGSLTINGVILKDIQAQGGANFIANNSILLGSSSGWTSTNTPSSQTYQ